MFSLRNQWKNQNPRRKGKQIDSRERTNRANLWTGQVKFEKIEGRIYEGKIKAESNGWRK